MKEYGRAIADYSEVIRLEPKSGNAYNTLAWLWATCPKSEFRDGKKAVEYARKACELTEWKDSCVLDTLAAACAEAGRFEEAVNWAKKALADPKFERTEREKSLQRLKLYEQRRPYRED